MEQMLKWAAIVSRSTAVEGGKERKERERVCVCVCVSKWGKCDTKAQQRHYSPPAHSAACRSLYLVCSYLQTRLLVHNNEKMVVRKGNDRSARALPCGVSRVWGNPSPARVHALHRVRVLVWVENLYPDPDPFTTQAETRRVYPTRYNAYLSAPKPGILSLRCHFHNFSQNMTDFESDLLSVGITAPVSHSLVIAHRIHTSPTAHVMRPNPHPSHSRAHSPPPSLDSRYFCVVTQLVLYCIHPLPTARTQTHGSRVSQPPPPLAAPHL